MRVLTGGHVGGTVIERLTDESGNLLTDESDNTLGASGVVGSIGSAGGTPTSTIKAGGTGVTIRTGGRRG